MKKTLSFAMAMVMALGVGTAALADPLTSSGASGQQRVSLNVGAYYSVTIPADAVEFTVKPTEKLTDTGDVVVTEAVLNKGDSLKVEVSSDNAEASTGWYMVSGSDKVAYTIKKGLSELTPDAQKKATVLELSDKECTDLESNGTVTLNYSVTKTDIKVAGNFSDTLKFTLTVGGAE